MRLKGKAAIITVRDNAREMVLVTDVPQQLFLRGKAQESCSSIAAWLLWRERAIFCERTVLKLTA